MICVCIILLFGCQSNTTVNNEIASLEKSNEEAPSQETANKLIEAYLTYVKDKPTDHDNNSRYLYRAASNYYRMNRFPQAGRLLKQAIQDHFSGSNTANNIRFLATLSEEKLNDILLAKALNQGLVRLFPDHEEVDDAKKNAQGFGNLSDEIAKLQKEMYPEDAVRIDRVKALNYIKLSEAFALLNPNEEEAVNHLHRAGETARSILNYKRAIEIYDWIIRRFPDHSRTAQALFLKAFTLDNNMKKYEEARGLYEAFLEKYPNDDFADDTKFLLENLGKSDEEIIKSFEKK